MQKEAILQQGRDGENAFQEWLNREELGYLRIDQDWGSMSPVFIDAVKRPDYLLLLASIGFIGIDVKHSKLNNKYFTLRIDNEIEKAIAFEHYTRIYLWYAFKNSEDSNIEKWYFISAHKACEVGKKKYNKRDKVHFYEIDLQNFELISKAEDLSRLFRARIGLLGRFTRAVEHGFKSIHK